MRVHNECHQKIKIKCAVWSLATRREVVVFHCLDQRNIFGLHTTCVILSYSLGGVACHPRHPRPPVHVSHRIPTPMTNRSQLRTTDSKLKKKVCMEPYVCFQIKKYCSSSVYRKHTTKNICVCVKLTGPSGLSSTPSTASCACKSSHISTPIVEQSKWRIHDTKARKGKYILFQSRKLKPMPSLQVHRVAALGIYSITSNAILGVQGICISSNDCKKMQLPKWRIAWTTR